MELLGLLLILTAIADKLGRALGWCFMTLVKGYALLIVATVRLIIVLINRLSESSTEENPAPTDTTTNPNIEDAIAGLKRLGLPEAVARRTVVAAGAGSPSATVEELIRASLQSLDAR